MRSPFTLLVLSLLVAPQESGEHEAARKKLKLAPGTEVMLWAADPHVQNPVAISIDEKGRIYVAECWRRHTSTLDIHMRKEWLDDDLACRRHEEQVAYHVKRLGEKAKDWRAESERIRIVEDQAGKGKADRAVTFSDGYHELCEGIGAGILVRNGEVWYTCIPNLWHLKDNDGDGKADVRKSLHSGFGVHLGASGHDMHGLRFGPDGKLYWSHGDRGFHVESEGKVFSFPDGGGVFRSNPDGSELELVCVGLRNPQELQFDQYGNLFTGDNNISKAPDVGETCRWTYIVEGADYGWRIGYQFMEKGGAWCAEEQWKLEAGYQVPHVARLGHGPSGVTYHPGVAAIPDRYQNHFFMCDYPGGIYAFQMKPKGASFEMVGLEKFLWDLQTPDVEFGPDGAMYVADWVGMWDKVDKGRIWKVADPERLKDPRVLEVKKLISEGMKDRPVAELATLMAHRDQRIRQAAQFELAARKESAALAKLLEAAVPQLARIHAIWGLGQLKAKEPLVPLLGDGDAEIRAQAAKTLGNLKTVLAYDKFAALLKDESPRVRFFAAMGLGKIGKREALPAVIEFLRTNNSDDRMLQHAGIMALTWIEDVDAIAKLSSHESAAVRMAALVALRKLQRPEAAAFLRDSDPKLVLEAARAIYDTPIPAAFPELVRVLNSTAPERAQLRALNAAYRLGDLKMLLGVASTDRFSTPLRLEALKMMGEWDQPSGRDRLMGLWRPMPAVPRQDVADHLQAGIGGLLQQGPPEVAMEAARLAIAFKIDAGLGDFLHGTLTDGGYSGEMMASALRALSELKDARFTADLMRSLKAKEPELVREAAKLVPQAKLENGASLLEALAIREGPISVRQAAIASLGELGADAVLAGFLDRGAPAALQLDLAEAAAKRPALKAKATALTPSLQEGGDAAAGRRIFFERSDVQCLRCHTIGSEGGQVGPPLTKIAEQKTREYLLESILTPNKQIAEGWGQTAFQLQNDAVEVGRIEKESDADVTLILPEGQKKSIAKGDIKARKAALSSMPEDLAKNLSKRDLRDLVEFLSTLK